MTEQELEERWRRRLAARRALDDEAYRYAEEIAAMIGGNAEIDNTREKIAILRAVWKLPKYNREARERILNETE